MKKQSAKWKQISFWIDVSGRQGSGGAENGEAFSLRWKRLYADGKKTRFVLFELWARVL